MNSQSRLEIAQGSLDRTLEFFSRVDAKASFILALNTGMLALLALNFDYNDILIWSFTGPFILAVLGLSSSLFNIYHCQFPQLKGGSGSKFYFKEIASRTEAQFIDEFLKEKEDGLLKDVLGQVWRNSEILNQKYAALKLAFIFTALSLLPWLTFLAVTTSIHSGIKVV